jgi:hypothetical protein
MQGSKRLKFYIIFAATFGIAFTLASERSSMSNNSININLIDRCGIFDEETLSDEKMDAIGDVILSNGNLRSFINYRS